MRKTREIEIIPESTQELSYASAIRVNKGVPVIYYEPNQGGKGFASFYPRNPYTCKLIILPNSMKRSDNEVSVQVRIYDERTTSFLTWKDENTMTCEPTPNTGSSLHSFTLLLSTKDNMTYTIKDCKYDKMQPKPLYLEWL